MTPERQEFMDDLVIEHRLTVEELLEEALVQLARTSSEPLKDAADDVREALVKIRLWVIGQGVW